MDVYEWLCEQCSSKFMACLCLFRQVLNDSPPGSIQSLAKHPVEPFDTAKLQHCTTDKVLHQAIYGEEPVRPGRGCELGFVKGH